MSYLSATTKLSARLLLLPSTLTAAPASNEQLLIGGQAVIEGVMMRAPHSYCVAVRKPSGVISTETQAIRRPSERWPVFRYPLLRGLGTLGQALALGVRSLKFSANAALDEVQTRAVGQENADGQAKSEPFGNWFLALNIAFSLGFFIFLYKFVPLVLATRLQASFPALSGRFWFNVVDGLVRLGIFLVFIIAISWLKDIRRVFAYHGAEHKVVFNFESGKPVSIANARGFSTLHPRCGTSFLMVVMLVSLVLYMLIPFTSFAGRFVARVLLLPVIAGVSFEVIRFAARRQGTLWAAAVRPGLWLQRITTKPPADDQLECAITALEGAMALEREQGGEAVIA